MLAKQVTYPSGWYERKRWAGWVAPGCASYAPVDTLVAVPTYQTRANTIIGGGVPNWKALIASQQSATSGRTLNILNVRSVLEASGTRRDWVYPESHVYFCKGVKVYIPAVHFDFVRYNALMPSVPPAAGPIASRLSVAAWSDITRRLTSMYRDGLLGETLASAHRAVDLIRHPFKRATGLIDAYRRRAERRVSRFMSSVPPQLRGAIARGRMRTADAWGRSSPGRRQWRRLLRVEQQLREDWLYYSFGVLNALQDLESVVKATNREMRKGAVRRVRVRKEATIEATSAPSTLINFGFGLVTGTSTLSCTIMHSVLLGVLETQRDQTRRESSLARLGLSAEAFIPTLWAVMPSSWAVDYFLDVDGHIDDWLARKLTIAWGSESSCTRTTRTTNTGVTLLATMPAADRQHDTIDVTSDNDIELFIQTRKSVSTIPYKPWTVDIPSRPSQFANLWAVHSPTKRIGVNSWT